MNKQTEALKLALEALEETRNALAWFYDSYPQDVTKKGNELLPHVETVLAAIREALAEQPAQQDSETITQNFTGLPKRKLRDLLSAGWQINGVCFQRTEEDGTVRRGAATTGGMVLWWNTEQPAQQQEPVAYASDVEFDDETEIIPAEQKGKLGTAGLRIALYIEPPASKPLTDEEIETAMPSGIYDCLADPWDCGVGDGNEMRSIKKDVLRIARAVEAKLREKNA